MNKFSLAAIISAVLLSACNTTPVQPSLIPTKAFGVLELNLNSSGASSARFEGNAQIRALSFRETDVVFGAGTTQVISSTGSAFDYLVATFPVSHAASSTTAFSNLTLYALAKNGNVGDTAIKTIANFGGATVGEQTRLAKLVTPVHAVKDNGSGLVVMDNAKADFQAFDTAEVTAATTTAGTAITALDTILNYGFSARCTVTCTSNSRIIALGSQGTVSIALRVPKAASSTAYQFVMNFVVMDASPAKVTRGMYPPESVSAAEARGAGVGASMLTQFGLNVGATSLSSQTVDDVRTSKLGASIQALGIGRIDAGYDLSCGLNAAGIGYCWGSNFSGRLGNNSLTDSSVPVPISGGLTFSSISVGNFQSCGLTMVGSAYCWGDNFNGQLGNNNAPTDSSVPVPVSGGLIFSSISVGNSYSCGLTMDGSAYCWGYNNYGQLGNNSSVYSSVPVPVSGGLSFSSISGGGFHSCGVTTAGSAYCWGRDSSGQLGSNSSATPRVPVLVNGGLSFSSISAGGDHSCGLTTTGSAYCWGSNISGELGNNNRPTNSSVPVPVSGSLSFSSITTGSNISCGLTTAGSAYCWGNNYKGGLGNSNAPTDSSVPVPVSGGLIFSSISGGYNHSCGVTTAGSAYCWGYNPFGQLGNNSTTDSSAPVAVTNTLFNL
jgi:alpha-tubulin suppressor-like RCC1 family protein